MDYQATPPSKPSNTAAKQEIFRVRRSYNQWVNNQTLEDYALRFTAKASRRWSLARVSNTALGAISFLILEAIGAAITLSYGFDNAVLAIAVVSTLIFFTGLPICYYAAKYGVDIDLLTRGAGFGYIGSTATSLIYSSFTFIFFALEAAIMAKALELILGIPLALGYILSSVIVIPLVFHGITFISRFQLWTQPLWLVLQILPFVYIIYQDAGLLDDWQQFQGSKQSESGINLMLFGAAASVMFSLIAQIGEQVDYLRFLPPKSETNQYRWWSALILAGPGWIIIGAIKIFAGSFLAVVAIKHGFTAIEAADPTNMYAIAFSYVTQNTHLAFAYAGVFVVICQLKINVTNAYAGSIAWSNFFSRLTHSHPGRVVWLVFNVAIALLLMELGIYQAFENTLSVYAIVAVSWLGALVADLVINKPLGLSPKHIEFKRAHLYDINPVGVGSMVLASVAGILSYLQFFGDVFYALAHFVALATAFLCVPLFAILTRSRYYIARTPPVFSDAEHSAQCCVCQNHYEIEDIACCPAYDGYICSLCCSLDARCLDSCKEDEKLSKKIIAKINSWLPKFITGVVNIRFVNFLHLLSVVSTVTGVLLALIFTNTQTGDLEIDRLLSDTLWKVFFILVIVAGVISWLFVLAHESRVVAQEESQTQTKRLINEIDAHEKTDKLLQIAKDQADAANNAKSRYLTGISHELRTPLNTVLGYAQLLELDSSLPKHIAEQISIIKRGGTHLANLIEGLLDISKIEAGRLDIHRNVIEIDTLLDQFCSMFRMQSEDKGLQFVFQKHSRLPKFVYGDEKRIRQILFNLLSNAVKFTESGTITFSIRYRNGVAEIEVADTGIGIPDFELERIFRPFERVRHPDVPAVGGTGLGLTITRLLIDIMGGDISVSNNNQGGATFRIQLALSQSRPTRSKQPKPITGYEGNKKTVFVVDDDAAHRGLIFDLLSPIGFNVVEAPNAGVCLDMIDTATPDIFLLDQLMPDIEGSQLARMIRAKGIDSPILIVSANAIEAGLEDEKDKAHDDFVVKPIMLTSLLDSVGKHLVLNWSYKHTPITAKKLNDKQGHTLSSKQCQEIIHYAEIGHLHGLRQCLSVLEDDASIDSDVIKNLAADIQNLQFDHIITMIEEYEHD